MNESAYDRTLSRLFALRRFGVRPGLQAISEALATLGNPQHAFDAIHVAGSNGKGSTSAMIESVLRVDGRRTGLYTSPHLARFTERIRVSGIELDRGQVAPLYDEVTAAGPELTFFEVVTALGARVLGSVHAPFNTDDFSSYLLQAQSSGAQIVAFANIAADTVNSIKQSHEFGLTQSGRKLVGLLVEVTTPRPIHRIPQRGGVLAGLVNIRGELHLCAHLDAVLGVGREPSQADAPKRPRARLLVVRRESERWVFPVDEVDEVHRFSRQSLTGSPATLSRSLARLTRGVFHHNERSIGLLDEERLFHTLRGKTR